MTVELQTAIIIIVNIIANVVVGVILSRQIRSQNKIIKHYKNLVAAYDIQYLKSLHEAEKQALSSISTFTIEQLQVQVSELAHFTHNSIIVFNMQHRGIGKPFDKDYLIDARLPHCKKVLSEIQEQEGSGSE